MNDARDLGPRGMALYTRKRGDGEGQCAAFDASKRCDSNFSIVHVLVLC